MILPRDFKQLRLSELHPELEIFPADNLQFMERTWVGEESGFTNCLQLKDSPWETRALALDLSDISLSAAQRTLDRLRLPLRPGMTAEQVKKALGSPFATRRYVDDRVSLEFGVGMPPDAYKVSCTIHEHDGLIYLVIMLADWERDLDSSGGCDA